jgi:formylglycine-generating enzyme required for sulfatase activity
VNVSRWLLVSTFFLALAIVHAQDPPYVEKVTVRKADPAKVSAHLRDPAGRLILFNYFIQDGAEQRLLPWGEWAPAKMGEVLVEVPFSPADLATFNASPLGNIRGVGTYQAGGPEHGFFIGKFEVTNDELATFLNSIDTNPNNTLGSFTFIDESDGAFYFSESLSTTTLLFDPAESLVQFNTNNLAGSRFVVPSGAERHPATGISWYGALKYCNWLTVFNGLGNAARCYTEGLTADDWHPVTASSWPAFTMSERDAWVAGFEGFRLPMYDDPLGDSNLHNEFSKAARWTGVRSPQFGHGRFLFFPFDGNYFDSNDPYADVGTTPVGYYDGTFKAGRTGTDGLFRRGQFTRRQVNGYDLFDMTGNVGEWQTDGFATNWRVVAGGTHRSTFQELEVDDPLAVIPYAGLDFIGMRLAKSTSTLTGTNVASLLPLSLSPPGSNDVFNITGGGIALLSAAYGDITNYQWSLSNPDIGSLDLTNENATAIYNMVEGSNNVLQEVTITDGITTETSLIFHVESPI